jgi:general secretion pathway protein G
MRRWRLATVISITVISLISATAVLAVLVSIVLPIYHRSMLRSKESILKNNLYTLRAVIDEYTYAQHKAPRTLQDLVSNGYLRRVPMDPITGSADTWKQMMEDATNTVNQTEPGIFDIRSGSELTSLEGTPYSKW